MSGIAGTVDLRAGLPADAATLAEQMALLVAHRGGGGALSVVVDPPAALAWCGDEGSVREARSANGEKLRIVFDGEVYNRPELLEELHGLGRPAAETDAGVVLEAYRAWGEEALDRLNGVFAFAIWDARRERLVCARDRFGLKPLYYTVAGGRFRFASEIKALLADPVVRRAPNDARVLDFLVYGISDHTPETMFAGVRQLPGGSLAVVTPDGAIGVRRWYRPAPAALDGRSPAAAVREVLSDAVALRLRGDAVVGCGISGGLDSSSCLALAAESRAAAGLPAPDCFTLRAATPELDESRYAEAAARRAGAAYHWGRADAEGLVADLPSLLWHMDEPVHAAGVYGHWKLMELAASAGMGALIEGQAGDDVFSGVHTWYPHFFYSFLAAGRPGRALAEARARRNLQGVRVRESATDFLKLLVPARARARYRPAWIRPGARVERRPLPPRSLKGRQVFELTVSTLPAFSREVDRDSTAFGIKARSPFLDHRVVELGLALPPGELMHEGWTKWPLREAMRDLLPSEVVMRREKQGFTVDQADWLRGPVGSMLDDAIASGTMGARPYFDSDSLARALAAHRAGEDHAAELWRALSVEHWLRTFVDAETVQAQRAA